MDRLQRNLVSEYIKGNAVNKIIWSKIILVSLGCIVVCGCTWIGSMLPEKPLYNAELDNNFLQTILRQSTSADVLAAIYQMPEYELLSQSQSVVASWGQKQKARKMWFNMVAFDEDKLTAKRKYFFVIREAKAFWSFRKHSCRFDTEMVMNREILDKPFANENARRTAVLQQVLESFREDIRQLREDNKNFASCGMIVNQTLKAILQQLNHSPILASKLSGQAGLDFDHITLGKGKIRMELYGDIVKVNVKIPPPSKAKTPQNQQDAVKP